MINKFKPKSEFSRNVLTLMTGATIAQAIPIAISPILTRIYTPEDFGVLALFVAITAILGSIVNGRYELAIMLPKKDEDAINIFALGFIITCFISLILLILVLVFNDYFTKLLGNEEISFWLYFVPIAVFFTGIWNILNYFNNRKKQYKDIAKATIIKSILTAIVQLSVGFIKSGVTGLISGQIVSQLFANTKLFSNIIKDKLLLSRISKVKIIALAKRYKDFPRFSMPGALSNTVSSQLPSLFIPKIFTLTISGNFFLANKIVNLPASLISGSVSQVLLQNLTENKNKKLESLPLLINTLKKLIFIALPITIMGYILSPYIFPFLFGENWVISGEIAQYLFLIFFVHFSISPLSASFVPAMELKKGALWQYLYCSTSIIFYSIVMYIDLDLDSFLIFLIIHEYILYLIFLYLIFLSVKKMDKDINFQSKGL